MTTGELEDNPTLRVRALAAARSDDRGALRAEVIESLLPLSDRLARRYRGLGIPMEDLRQVAATGLIKSVDGYQAEVGGFVAYAVPTITGELRRYLRDRAWAVRPPRGLQELALRVHHAAEEVCVERGHVPGVAELAEVVGSPIEDVRRALAAFRAYMAVSLDSAPRQDDPVPLVELLPGPDPGIDAMVDRVALASAVTTLPAREQAIIRMRFLDELTQQEIANRLGISQAHVSGILTRTLRNLRRTLSAESAEAAGAAGGAPPGGEAESAGVESGRVSGRSSCAPTRTRHPQRPGRTGYGLRPCQRRSGQP